MDIMPNEQPDLRNEYIVRSEEGFHLLQSLLSPEAKSTKIPDTPRLDQKKGLLESAAKKISSWLSSHTGHASSIVWLTGLPNLTSLHEVVALCESSQQLVAMFSFSTRKGDQQKQEMLPSLAYQIAINIPYLRSAIGFAMFQDPQILSKPLDRQMRYLILRPFDELVSMGTSPARPVVIIDGIELYHDRYEQEILISHIELAVTSMRLPLRFIFTNRSLDYTPPFHSATHIHIENSIAPMLQYNSLVARFPSHPTSKSSGHTSRGFPRLVQTQYSVGGAESYTRALMMLGHGIPLWDPQGSYNRPVVHLETGVRIGDVMLLNPEGTYNILLNIFCDESDPVQTNAIPGYFRPIYPPLDSSEVRYTNFHFKPGTAITSPGVTATTVSTSPLHIHIEANSREGGVLVLPDGASREDLVSTQRFRAYVKKWAPYWYRMAVGINGQLFLVTGCDKAADFAILSFPSERPSSKNQLFQSEYRETDTETSHPWSFNCNADVYENWYRHSSYQRLIGANRPKGAQHLCVFVRGMHIALGESTWSGAIGQAYRDETRFYTTVLHKTPSLDQATTAVLALLHRRFSEPSALKELPLQRKQFFHPIFFLGPALLSKYPSAMAVLIEDTIWCSFVNKQDSGSLDAFNKLVDRVLENTTSINEDGAIYLSTKTETTEDPLHSTPLAVPSNRRDDRWGKLIPISQYAEARIGRPTRPVFYGP